MAKFKNGNLILTNIQSVILGGVRVIDHLRNGKFSKLKLDATLPEIDKFSTDGTLIGDSNDTVPTEKAIKTYVDTAIAGSGSNKIWQGDSKVEVVDVGSGHIDFTTDGNKRWEITSAGNIVPTLSDTNNVGSATNRVQNIFIGDTGRVYLGNDQEFEAYHNGASAYLATAVGSMSLEVKNDSGYLQFRTGDATSTKWLIPYWGAFLPGASNTYDIGGSASEIRDIYIGRRALFGINQKMYIMHDDTNGSIHTTSGHLNIGSTHSISSILFQTGNPVTTRWEINAVGYFMPGSGDAYNIGTSIRTVKSIYLSNSLYLGTSQEAFIYHSTGNLFIRNTVGNTYIDHSLDTSELQFRTGASRDTRWHISGADGHFLPGAANTYDIGSTDNEIRNLYIAGSAYFGDNQSLRISDGIDNTASDNIFIAVENDTSDLEFRTGTTPALATKWKIENAGHLIPGGNGLYNIGSSTMTVKTYHANTGKSFAVYDDAGVEELTFGHNGAYGFWSANGAVIIRGKQTGGYIGFGTGDPNSVRWRIKSDGDFTPGADNTYDIGENGRTVGYIYSLGTYNYGMTSGRNMYINSNGRFGYLTSALKYKENIIDIEDTSWIYDLRPVAFNAIGKTEHEVGFIAEEVEQINDDYTFYEEDGEIAGVNYRQINIALLKEVQNHKKEIEQLQEAISNLT